VKDISLNASSQRDLDVEMLKKVESQDINSLAKFLSLLEAEGASSLSRWPDLTRPTQVAFRLGVTGPPGAGKSTLIDRMITLARQKGMTVAVLAIDPSSPITQGAILGDRIRYQRHFLDEKVFIRSLGSRGSLGGLSGSAWMMVRAFDIAKFDLVILETVGVGQVELEVMNVADFVALVLVPESGDGIQGMKAGILEIADTYIINKADRPGADIFENELRSALELGAYLDRSPAISKVSALSGEGVPAALQPIWDAMLATKGDSPTDLWRVRRQSPKRLQAELKALVRDMCQRWIDRQSQSIKNSDELRDAIEKISAQFKS
jgi:LAO/AO transport system kinase